MLPLLNEGSEAIEAQIQDAHDLGLVIDGEAVSAGAKLGDTLADIKAVFGTIGTQLAVQILPIVQQLADYILEHAPEIQTVIGGLVAVMGLVVKAIGLVAGKVLELTATFMTNIISAVDSFIWLVEKAKEIAPQLWQAGKDAINKFLDGIKSAWNGVKTWIEDKVN